MSSSPVLSPPLRRTVAHWRVVVRRRLRLPRRTPGARILQAAMAHAVAWVLIFDSLPATLGLPTSLDAFNLSPVDLVVDLSVIILVAMGGVAWLAHVWPDVPARADRWLSVRVRRRRSRGQLVTGWLVVSALLAWGSLLHLTLLPLSGESPWDLRAAVDLTLRIWVGSQWPLLLPWFALGVVQAWMGTRLGRWTDRRLAREPAVLMLLTAALSYPAVPGESSTPPAPAEAP